MDQKRNSTSVDAEDKIRPLPFSRVRDMESRATDSTGYQGNEFRADNESAPGAGGVVRELESLLSNLIGWSKFSMAVAGQDLLICGYLRQIQRASLNACALVGKLPESVNGHTRVFRTVDIGELVRESEAGLRMLLPVDATLEIRCAGPIMPALIDPIILEKLLMQFAASSLAGFEAPAAIEIEVRGQSSEAERGQQVAISLLSSSLAAPASRAQARESHRIDVGTERHSAPIMVDTSAATNMISRCGGSLSVDYIPGKKLSLLVTLPKSGDDLEDLPLRDASGFLPMGTETVLVVQREPSTREVVCHILGAQGYKVLEAASYEEALDLAKTLEPGKLALVIADSVGSIDRVRPEGSGSGKLPSNVRRLYTSTYVEAATKAPNVMESDGAFVDSPFTPRSLVCKVREVLDGGPR